MTGKVKFGLTKKEERLYQKACSLLGKAEKAQNDFYESVKNRFDKFGYDGDEVLDWLISSDSYVFSESGCTEDDSIWDEIKKHCKREVFR